ncbi:LexA-binding, inner membrane-associated putative hydrolase [Streptomyces zhaozhouensis]|uniref:LexA-binding, inner membrane-associated putative hydrolase n=1 Tax=Streptomyces zhaozhouensis TaxID=1300267 RepID=A0A286DVM7_9ACTN|nr:metal-dependent hydrolase [Streptomyces zhaozhouensis]SOD62739.1 LexA-binding, inner membrane-associated putative hydrolase [Streptomyces zhaozhouensis]
MMGPAHSLSGAMAWLGVGAAAAAADHAMPWPVLVAGTLICAGAALAPDLDHKSATISRAFGPFSRILAGVIDKLSSAVYNSTRGPRDRRRSGGHRTLTHTWIWAVLLGAGFSGAAILFGRWAVLFTLFVHMVLAVEGLLWRMARVSSDVLVWLLGGATAWIVAGVLNEPGNGSNWLFTDEPYAWLGLPIVLGAIVHTLGDSITISGCPMLWPLKISGRRWYPLGTPSFMRFRAGAWVENRVLMPAFVVIGAVSGVAAGLLTP